MGFLKDNHTNDPTVYANSIKDVGTFNSTGVTNFTMDNSTTNNISTDYVANDNLTKLSVTNDTNLVIILKCGIRGLHGVGLDIGCEPHLALLYGTYGFLLGAGCKSQCRKGGI